MGNAAGVVGFTRPGVEPDRQYPVWRHLCAQQEYICVLDATWISGYRRRRAVAAVN